MESGLHGGSGGTAMVRVDGILDAGRRLLPPGAGAALTVLEGVLEQREAAEPEGRDWWMVSDAGPGGLVGLVDGRHRRAEAVGIFLEDVRMGELPGGTEVGLWQRCAGGAESALGVAFPLQGLSSCLAGAACGAARAGGGMVGGHEEFMLDWDGFAAAFGELLCPDARWSGPWRRMPALDVPVWPGLTHLRERLRRAGMRLDARVMRELVAEAVRFSAGAMPQPVVDALLVAGPGPRAHADREGAKLGRPCGWLWPVRRRSCAGARCWKSSWRAGAWSGWSGPAWPMPAPRECQAGGSCWSGRRCWNAWRSVGVRRRAGTGGVPADEAERCRC